MSDMYEEKNMERISITVPQQFLEEFDRSRIEFGYAKRSEAIRDAMRNLFKNETSARSDAEVNGFVIIAYNHHQRGLLDELTEIEHQSHIQIFSSMHIHVSEHNCSEVMAVKGKAGDVHEFKKRIQTIKGILFCELVVLYTFPATPGEPGSKDGNPQPPHLHTHG